MNAFMIFEFKKKQGLKFKEKSLGCKDQSTRIQTSFFEIEILILKFQRTFLNNKVWI